jgi:hypothetical protein
MTSKVEEDELRDGRGILLTLAVASSLGGEKG